MQDFGNEMEQSGITPKNIIFNIQISLKKPFRRQKNYG